MSKVYLKKCDLEQLALEIVAFLRKWGLWKDVQIFTGGKCYLDNNGDLQIRDEIHPEKYTQGIVGKDCNGETEWKDFSNPERLLDMTFEGPLSQLLRYQEYEVCLRDLSDEVRKIILSQNPDVEDKVENYIVEFFEEGQGWDPVEYDSYEEWLELHQYCDPEEFDASSDATKEDGKEFSSKEEYEEFLERGAIIREAKLRAFFEDFVFNDEDYEQDTFYDKGEIACHVLNEFDELLEKYGLWYELGFEWSLTTYRI